MNLKEAMQKRNEYKQYIGKALPEKDPTGMIVEDIIVVPSNNIGNFMTHYHTGSEKGEYHNEHLLAQYPLSDYTIIIDYVHPLSDDGVNSAHETLEEYIKRNSA